MTDRGRSTKDSSGGTGIIQQLKTKQSGSSIELRAFERTDTIEIAVEDYRFILFCEDENLGERPEEKFKISGTIRTKALGYNAETSYLFVEDTTVLEAGDNIDIQEEKKKAGNRLFAGESQSSDSGGSSKPTKTSSYYVSGGTGTGSPSKKQSSKPNLVRRCPDCGAVVQGQHHCYAGGNEDYDPDNPGSLY